MWRVTVETDPVLGATEYVWSVSGLDNTVTPTPSYLFSVPDDGDLSVSVVARNATQTSPPSPKLTVPLHRPLPLDAPGAPRLVSAVYVP